MIIVGAKINKNYLRGTMSEQRLSGIAVLSIENLKKIYMHSIVDTFFRIKAQRYVLQETIFYEKLTSM